MRARRFIEQYKGERCYAGNAWRRVRARRLSGPKPSVFADPGDIDCKMFRRG